MKYLSSSLAVLCIAACAPTTLEPAGGGWGDAPPVTAADYALRDAATFSLTGQESLAEAGAIIQSALANPPGETVEGNYTEDLDIYSGAIIGLPRGAVVMTRENLSDDSVRSEQHVIEFDVSDETGAASATVYGIRFKCREGRGPTDWTAQLCS
ncbi:hypothetical protein [Paracoccus tegillarcae]|uniref:Lipoprotein n=1 Tax=Paracoccus tegillarcae TaxID=1529068 RepID=A0A2K9EQ67_9RHOB|nr:hypothetical protein [Paracoccus tegillarcae]AUH32876.1 hypothetical protein CUV01_05270 [Paracoccus tegillarcae]